MARASLQRVTQPARSSYFLVFIYIPSISWRTPGRSSGADSLASFLTEATEYEKNIYIIFYNGTSGKEKSSPERTATRCHVIVSAKVLLYYVIVCNNLFYGGRANNAFAEGVTPM